ncbi:MAG: DUF424 domain-containing protein [Thaumarchaeota archaeon]|nr:DUF424 domain-containing protein [Nitrososphaerota archaeon]
MGPRFSVRTSPYKDAVLVNICDEELIGRTVTEGRLQVHISKEFYFGEVVDRGEALRLIRSCSIVNLAGERSVSLAVDNEVGSREAVREIEGIPFLMIYKFSN